MNSEICGMKVIRKITTTSTSRNGRIALAMVSTRSPDTLEVTEAYWFAWKAHRPETEVWQGIFTDAADR